MGDSPPGFMSDWLSQFVNIWQPGTVCHDDIGGIPLPLESASMPSTRDLNILYHSERHLRKFDPWYKTTLVVRWSFTNRLPPFALTFSVTKFCLNCQKSFLDITLHELISASLRSMYKCSSGSTLVMTNSNIPRFRVCGHCAIGRFSGSLIPLIR